MHLIIALKNICHSNLVPHFSTHNEHLISAVQGDIPFRMSAITFSIYTNQSSWCEFDLSSSLIRGNKRPTRCKRLGFYCSTYCSLNMFRAPLCPSSGDQELYRWLLPVVLGAMVYSSLVWCGAVSYVSGLGDVELWVMCPVWGMLSCGLCVRFEGCWAVGYVSGLRDVELWVMCPVWGVLSCGLCVRFAGCSNP